MRKNLVKNTAVDIKEYLMDAYDVNVDIKALCKIIDNNLGFVVDAVEEAAVEVKIR